MIFFLDGTDIVIYHQKMIIDIFLPVSLAFIMFSLGLGLTVDDFKRVVKQPKAFAVGIVNQMLLLPLIAFAIINLFRFSGEMAVGLMVLACCPGGITSNIITKMAKGDTALSVSYTAVVSIATVITLPLVTGFSVHFFMKSQAPDFSILSLGLTMFLLTVIPVTIGLLVHHKASNFTKAFEPKSGIISTILFALILIIALVSEWDVFVENVAILGPAIILLIVVMLFLGYFSARLFRMAENQAVSVAIATGIQNATMGVTIGNLILPNADGLSVFSLPSGVYGILMYIVCLPIVFAYIKWIRKSSSG